MSKRLNLSFIKVGLALLIINFYYVIVYLHLYFPDPIPMTDKTTQQLKKIKNKFTVSLFSSEAPPVPGPRPRGRPHPRPSRIQSEINWRNSQSSLPSPAHGSTKRLHQQQKQDEVF